jgi:DNA-binding response OmpR family regulator
MAKVLVIEDEQAMSDMYSIMLKTDGHNVLQTIKGMEGFSLAVKEKPDIILLDYRLPDTNGLEVLKLLQKNSQKNTPVLIITNYAGDIDKEAVLKAGAKEIILKQDITPSMLLAIVNKYLGKKIPTKGGLENG